MPPGHPLQRPDASAFLPTTRTEVDARGCNRSRYVVAMTSSQEPSIPPIIRGLQRVASGQHDLALSQNPRGAAASPWPTPGALPGATQGLDRVLVLPINERYTEAHVAQVATAIRARTEELLRG